MSKSLRKLISKLLLVIAGVALPAVILFPFIPQSILQSRNVDIDFGMVQFKVKHGDIFAAQAGTIAPPANPEDVLSEHRLAWDDDGFRIGLASPDDYDIAAVGDSYTEAANVARPWADVLTVITGQDVRNFGYRGYGPQQKAQIIAEYVATENPKTVIVGFFGGNDLSDAGRYAEENESFTLPRIARESVQRWNADEAWNTQRDTYQYPVNLLLSEPTPIAFLNGYITWFTLDVEQIRQTQHFQATIAAWETMINVTPSDTCLVLAYFPHKAQIYLPYVQSDQQYLINDSLPEFNVSANGEIETNTDADVSYQTLLDNRHAIRDVVISQADAMGIQTIDLTPAFEEAASNGELLYYTYDTHWNQAGHNLAAQVIAAQLDQINCHSVE